MLKTKEITTLIQFAKDEVTHSGGDCRVSNAPGGGTKLSVSVPGKVAYVYMLNRNEARTAEQIKKAFSSYHRQKLGR